MLSVKHLGEPFKGAGTKMQMKVLCICPIGIGNYLLTYPACSAIKSLNPDIRLCLLGLRTGVADLAAKDPLWHETIVFDPTAISRDIIKQAGIAVRLRKERFDASLSFFPSNKWLYNLLPFIAGIPERYVFNYSRSRITSLNFLGTKKTPVDISLHDTRQNMALAGDFLGNAAVRDMALKFPLLYRQEDSQWAKEFLESSSERKCYVALHAGSSGDHSMIYKRWPSERFASVADKLCRELEACCIIMGGKEEEEIKNAVASEMNEPFVVLPQMSLNKTAAVISRCSLCLCNDSGLMHIASCSGVPTIAVFGPTDECRNGPAGEKTLVVRKQMPGFPVWTAANAGSRKVASGIDPSASLKALTVEDAWAQIEPWLKKQ
jgi:ADP-heptose:LPS heptosyltransferase